jgi:hypothetical protein
LFGLDGFDFFFQGRGGLWKRVKLVQKVLGIGLLQE